MQPYTCLYAYSLASSHAWIAACIFACMDCYVHFCIHGRLHAWITKLHAWLRANTGSDSKVFTILQKKFNSDTMCILNHALHHPCMQSSMHAKMHIAKMHAAIHACDLACMYAYKCVYGCVDGGVLTWIKLCWWIFFKHELCISNLVMHFIFLLSSKAVQKVQISFKQNSTYSGVWKHMLVIFHVAKSIIVHFQTCLKVCALHNNHNIPR